MGRRLAAFLIALALASPLSAQTITVSGVARDSTAIRFEALLVRNNYRLLDRDTTLGEGSFIGQDVVVVDARVNVEGTVRGSVAVVGGELFVRPSATITGEILEVGGAAYPSGLASIGGFSRLDAGIATELARAGSVYHLTLTEPPPRGVLRLPAPLGFAIPTYDRVNGLTLGWGTELGFGGDTATVSLIGQAGYAFARKRVGGSLELRVRPSPRSYLSLRASRSSRTRDAWIRGDLANSLSSVTIRSDLRNYFESDELSFTFGGLPPPPLIESERFLAPRIGLRVSDDRSLTAASPWSFTRRDETWRSNPAIDDGRLASIFGGVTTGWRGITARFGSDAAIEWSPGGVADFDFAQFTGSANWTMIGLPGHLVEAGGYLLLPVTGDVPRQRWSFVGGPGTLPTFATSALTGDHLLFVRSAYIVLVPFLPLPFVGPPSVRLEYAAGTAWQSGVSRPPLEQNVGVGIQLRFFTAMFYLDPAEDPRRAVFSLGAHLP